MDPLTLIIVILIILWLTGTFAFPVAGSAVHLLIVVILLVVLIKFLRGERV